MKKVKKEDGAGLQEWLSYQSRTREPVQSVQPQADIIDWDEGIEVQEEWLPRELCEQRLREEAERKLTPAIKDAPVQVTATAITPATAPASAAVAATPGSEGIALSATVELEDVPLAPLPAERVQHAAPVVKLVRQPECSILEFRSRTPTPRQFEAADLASAVPTFHR